MVVINKSSTKWFPTNFSICVCKHDIELMLYYILPVQSSDIQTFHADVYASVREDLSNILPDQLQRIVFLGEIDQWLFQTTKFLHHFLVILKKQIIC